MSISRPKNVKYQQVDFAKRRTENVTKVRKARRDEQISKRRNTLTNNIIGEEADQESDVEYEITVDNIPNLAALMKTSADGEKILQATTAIRKLLSKAKDPPIQEILASNIIDELIRFLRQ